MKIIDQFNQDVQFLIEKMIRWLPMNSLEFIQLIKMEIF